MRRFLMTAAVLTVVCAGSIGHAQMVMKVANLDDYKKAMQALGASVSGASKAIQSGAMADAKTQIGNAKMTMAAVQAFFVDKKKDDPAMLAKEALAKLDALEKASGGTDQSAAMGAFKEVGAACTACHTKYRDQDPATKAYSFKPGVL